MRVLIAVAAVALSGCALVDREGEARYARESLLRPDEPRRPVAWDTVWGPGATPLERIAVNGGSPYVGPAATSRDSITGPPAPSGRGGDDFAGSAARGGLAPSGEFGLLEGYRRICGLRDREIPARPERDSPRDLDAAGGLWEAWKRERGFPPESLTSKKPDGSP